MKQYSVLDTILSPEDIKKLSIGKLEQLCSELREFIIDNVSKTGGHLASNLGVVELTVALHRIFDTPQDEIVWDVGHQCYSHKILTGRKEQFNTLRQEGGISGFPKHAESVHDAFIAGHAGTSVSVACGIAKAKQLRGDRHKVIAVTGDGAFTNGMIYEALTNSAVDCRNLVIVLNDNEMSISENVSALAGYLTKIRSTSSYFKAKDAVEETLDKLPIIGEPVKRAVKLTKYAAKKVLYNTNFFSDLGLTYFGPLDGHDLNSLTEVFERVKCIDNPCIVHISTEKGKGYDFASSNPSAYHGVSKFDVEYGLVNYAPASGFSAELGKYITYLATKDERICAITAAMKDSTGLQPFAKRYPERFFDVGIAESHAVSFAGGLAAQGMIPVFAVYSSFLQRSYDQILHDLAIEPQHVLLAVDRAGIVGDDGETHQGMFDVAMLSNVPKMVIYSPATLAGLRYCVKQALYENNGPVAVRYPRGGEEESDLDYLAVREDFKLVKNGHKNLLVSYGRMGHRAADAAKSLLKEDINVSVLHLQKIYPLSDEIIEIISEYDNILFAEEGIKRGSISEYVGNRLMEKGFKGKYAVRAVENMFIPQAVPSRAIELAGLDSVSLSNYFRIGRQGGNN